MYVVLNSHTKQQSEIFLHLQKRSHISVIFKTTFNKKTTKEQQPSNSVTVFTKSSSLSLKQFLKAFFFSKKKKKIQCFYGHYPYCQQIINKKKSILTPKSVLKL